MCIRSYTLLQALIKERSTRMVIYVLTLSSIFLELKSSTLLFNLYVLIRRKLFLCCIVQYFKFTVPLVKQCVTTKGTLYGVSYLYAVWLRSITLSTTFIVKVNSMFILAGFISINLCLILLTYYLPIHPIFIRIIISRPNMNYPGL